MSVTGNSRQKPSDTKEGERRRRWKHLHNITGIVAPVDRVNVDTDAIIPKQFLKRIERTGFGQFLFFEWRFDEDGKRRIRILS